MPRKIRWRRSPLSKSSAWEIAGGRSCEAKLADRARLEGIVDAVLKDGETALQFDRAVLGAFPYQPIAGAKWIRRRRGGQRLPWGNI